MEKTKLSAGYINRSFEDAAQWTQHLIDSGDYVGSMINHNRARQMLRMYARREIYTLPPGGQTLLDNLHDRLDGICDEIEGKMGAQVA
ncbi:hypothetical protein HY450_00935 [Candidatus Pacearchaeota archaeon]|nr:hypothetical protein [Candidatus Pacearchaeota archaeon]